MRDRILNDDRRLEMVVDLNDTEKAVLILLERFNVLTYREFNLFLGYSYSYWKDLMVALKDKSLIESYIDPVLKMSVISLSTKAIRIFYPPKKRFTKKGKEYTYYRKPPKIKYREIDHELLVVEICYYILKSNDELSLNDIEIEKDIYRKNSKNKSKFLVGDILVNDKVMFEIERTGKEFSRYNERKKIKDLYENDKYLIYIINRDKKSIKKKLEKSQLANKIYYIEEIENINFDLSQYITIEDLQMELELLIENDQSNDNDEKWKFHSDYYEEYMTDEDYKMIDDFAFLNAYELMSSLPMNKIIKLNTRENLNKYLKLKKYYMELLDEK